MKKIVFLFLLATSMMFASSTNVVETVQTAKELVEQSKPVVNTVYNDSKDLVKQLYEDSKGLGLKLEEGLKYVAEGLKTTSIKAWDILVRQQLVWSFCYLFLTLLSMFSVYQFFKQYKTTFTNLDEDSDVKGSKIFLSVIFGLIALTSSVGSGLHFEQMITGFVNPEYGALKTLFEVISDFKNIK